MPQLDAFVCDALAAFFNKQAFEEVKCAVAAGLSRTVPAGRLAARPTLSADEHCAVAPSISKRQSPLKPGEQVTVTSPARVDFGGGWSDTPPHSLRRGGAVLNAAIRLDGRQPIRATVRVLPDPVLKLVSSDAGVDIALHDWRDALDHSNPSDAVALHKAAVCCTAMAFAQGARATGDPKSEIRNPQSEIPRPPQSAIGNLKFEIRNPKSEIPLSDLGLEIITETNVPQGSGLGTSSILGAVVLRALFELFRVRPKDRHLFSYVSNLEQMMSTGGGWQDQIGGITPGIKLITTKPGAAQTPRIVPVELSASTRRQLSDRVLLFYVGERRIAKDILQAIMGKYISGDATTLHILTDIQRIAREMKRALEGEDLDRFGALMWEHWELNKKLDPQSTTPHIEEIVEQIRPLVSGLKMVGAGGGGFMEIVCRRRYRRALEALLADLSETDETTVYGLDVDDVGPRVM